MTSYEVRMSDSVVNTGLDDERFATREEAETAAETVNAVHEAANAEAIETTGEPTLTLAEWQEAGW